MSAACRVTNVQKILQIVYHKMVAVVGAGLVEGEREMCVEWRDHLEAYFQNWQSEGRRPRRVS